MPLSTYRCDHTATTHEDDISDMKSQIPDVLEECERIFQSERISDESKMHVAYNMQVAKGVYNS